VSDPEVSAQAENNTIENLPPRLRPGVHEDRGRTDDNEAIFKRIEYDEEFRQVLMDLYAGRVYRRARRGSE
jgi:hypothetical protein